MEYAHILPGIFQSRPNRFLAEVEINGIKELCHVKNTGRCRELLVPGARVYVQKSERTDRKTAYDLIAVKKKELLINVDSQVPNAVVEEWLLKEKLLENITLLKREVRFGDSRFDLYAEYGDHQKAFLEVKGVTLESDTIARFPDAPTRRGLKHIMELCECQKEGYEAYLIFVIQMKGVSKLQPNWDTHKAFGDALREADKAGVHILAYDCLVTPDTIVLDKPVEVDLGHE